MPSLTSITVNDRETTPVAHVYVPQNIEGGVATFANRDGTPLGDESFTMSMRRTASGLYKVRLQMVDPVVVDEVINGVTVPKVSRIARANLELTFDAASTGQERDNLIGKLADALSSSQTLVMGVAKDLEGMY